MVVSAPRRFRWGARHLEAILSEPNEPIPVLQVCVAPDDPTGVSIHLNQAALPGVHPSTLIGSLARLQFELMAQLMQPVPQPKPELRIVRAAGMPQGLG